MRVVQAAALTAAALLLASFASAQGLGSLAAREREKRKTTGTAPAKVYKDGDLGASVAPAGAVPELPPSTGEDAAAGASAPTAPGAPGEGQPAASDAAATAAKGEAAAAKAEAERQAAAQAAWKKNLDQARKEQDLYKDLIGKLQQELDDNTVSPYSPGRLGKVSFLEENKQKLAQVQARIASLEDEGRRSNYR
jgi:hypothetical protein